MPELRQSLLHYDTDMLLAIAAGRGIEAGDDLAGLRDRLVADGTGALSVRLLWEQLGEPERRALCRLGARGGVMRAVYFEHEYGAVRHFGPGRLTRERLWEHPANTTERLLFLGLIFRGFEESGEAAIWYLPSDVLALLPLDQCPGDTLQTEPAPVPAEVTLTRAAGDFALLAVFHAVVAARLREAPLEAAVIGRLTREPAAPDEERLRSMAHLGITLAEDAGFIRREAIASAARAKRWLGLPRRAALRHVCRLWLASGRWQELLHAPGIVYEGGHLPDAGPARRLVCHRLSGLAAGAWYRVADLQAWLWQAEPEFLRRNADFGSLYLRDAGGSPLEGVGAWMEVEGRFVEEVVVALNALGAVSLGVAAGQRCFRIDDGAALAPGAAPDDTATSAEARPRLAPDLTIACPPEAPLICRFQLGAFADRTVPEEHYRITRASLRRAAQAGIGSDRVLAYLEKQTSGLDDAARQAIAALATPESISAERLVVLRAEHDDTLPALATHASLAPHLAGWTADGRLLVLAARWREVEALLRRLGYRLAPPGTPEP